MLVVKVELDLEKVATLHIRETGYSEDSRGVYSVDFEIDSGNMIGLHHRVIKSRYSMRHNPMSLIYTAIDSLVGEITVIEGSETQDGTSAPTVARGLDRPLPEIQAGQS